MVPTELALLKSASGNYLRESGSRMSESATRDFIASWVSFSGLGSPQRLLGQFGRMGQISPEFILPMLAQAINIDDPIVARWNPEVLKNVLFNTSVKRLGQLKGVEARELDETQREFLSVQQKALENFQLNLHQPSMQEAA